VDLIQSQARDIRDSAPDGSRDRFISLQDVCRMARAVEEEDIRLHEEDGISHLSVTLTLAELLASDSRDSLVAS